MWRHTQTREGGALGNPRHASRYLLPAPKRSFFSNSVRGPCGTLSVAQWFALY